MFAGAWIAAIAGTVGSTDRVSNSNNPYLGNTTLISYLEEISDWVMLTGVGNNELRPGPHGGHPFTPTCNDSIFINGNLARTLLATSKIIRKPTKAAAYRAEGLRWCDAFVAAQLPITTSKGVAAGYWNTGYNEVYIADTGTAVVTLTLCVELQRDPIKLQRYATALAKYASFVTEGCISAPTNPPVGTTACPASGNGTLGWVITAGKDRGGLGDGWYEKRLNDKVYTIATATTGSCAFVETAKLVRDGHPIPLRFPVETLDTIGKNAVGWLLQSRTPDGRIPYIITPEQKSSTVFQPIT